MNEERTIKGSTKIAVNMTAQDGVIILAALRNMKGCFHECVGIMDGEYKENTQRMLDAIDHIGSIVSNAIEEATKE